MKMTKFGRTSGIPVVLALALALALAGCQSPAGDSPPGPAAISLSVTEPHVFGQLQVGYADVTPLTVTVTNTGGRPTGVLNAELSGAYDDSFTVSAVLPNNIPAGGTASFTVAPNHDLPIGVYAARVTVSGGAGITSRSFDVSFTVTGYTDTPIFSIILDADETESFGPFQVGYSDITPRQITVTNTGNQPTGVLSAELSGAGAESFTVSAISPSDIPVGGNATFTVRPNTGLQPGVYTATVTVSGASITDNSFAVSFTVTPVCDACNDAGCETCTPPGSGDFSIDFAGFTDAMRPYPANITGPTLNLRDNNAAGEIRITGIPADAVVNWFFQNDPAPIANGTAFAGGTATLALDSALHGGRVGTYTVTVEVLVGGRLYSRIITFRVMP